MKPALRFTRRGPMVFCAADQGVAPGSSEIAAAAAAAKKKEEPASAENKTDAVAVDHKAKLLALLGLDETADDAAIDAAIAAMPNAAELQTRITGLETELAGATEKISGFEKEGADRTAAEIDTMLAEYPDLADDARAVLREQLIADPVKGKVLLSALPKKKTEEHASPKDESAVADAKKAAPPSPQHDAAADAAGEGEMTDEQKVEKQNALIKEIQKDGKFTEYEPARAEARRRKPELFS